jgi:hypothetical protein
MQEEKENRKGKKDPQKSTEEGGRVGREMGGGERESPKMKDVSYR